jgi:lipoate-protein ligase A
MPHLLQLTGCDPRENLAIEEHLLRSHDGRSVVALLYRNRPSVVVGRNQNPWLECNPAALAQKDIPVIRRVSGGGTVYHDAGNLNYSLLLPRPLYAPEDHVDLVCQALRTLGVPAERNERNDITLDNAKISGTAYMLGGKTALHHGTLLVGADLQALRMALAPCPGLAIETRAVASVKARVANIRDCIADFPEDRFAAEFAAGLAARYGPVVRQSVPDGRGAEPAALANYLRKYADPEWNLGRTPTFTA